MVYIYHHITLLGVDYRTKEILINHEKIKLEIWDTAGQERFKALTVKYYQKADGIIIAFSVDDYSSFQLLDSWINGAKANSMNASLILVGCKCDIDNDKRVVSKHEAIMFAQKHGIQYIETSARENINILLIFEEITRTIKVNEGIRPIIPSIVLTPLSKNEKKICNC